LGLQKKFETRPFILEISESLIHSIFAEIHERREYMPLTGTKFLDGFVKFLIQIDDIGPLLTQVIKSNRYADAESLLKAYAASNQLNLNSPQALKEIAESTIENSNDSWIKEFLEFLDC
jgi:hypothetical protein